MLNDGGVRASALTPLRLDAASWPVGRNYGFRVPVASSVSSSVRTVNVTG